MPATQGAEYVLNVTSRTKPSARSVVNASLLKNVAMTTNTLAPSATKNSSAPIADNAMPKMVNSANRAACAPIAP